MLHARPLARLSITGLRVCNHTKAPFACCLFVPTAKPASWPSWCTAARCARCRLLTPLAAPPSLPIVAAFAQHRLRRHPLRSICCCRRLHQRRLRPPLSGLSFAPAHRRGCKWGAASHLRLAAVPPLWAAARDRHLRKPGCADVVQGSADMGNCSLAGLSIKKLPKEN